MGVKQTVTVSQPHLDPDVGLGPDRTATRLQFGRERQVTGNEAQSMTRPVAEVSTIPESSHLNGCCTSAPARRMVTLSAIAALGPRALNGWLYGDGPPLAEWLSINRLQCLTTFQPENGETLERAVLAALNSPFPTNGRLRGGSNTIAAGGIYMTYIYLACSNPLIGRIFGCRIS